MHDVMGYCGLMSQHDDGEPVEEIAEHVADSNTDETTRREAFEQELESRGRSDEGAEVGDEIE
ncbi:MAG: hypothetical protein QOH79_3671 [Acidimicrobiaceae bacterium]|jgi:hypothetical protein